MCGGGGDWKSWKNGAKVGEVVMDTGGQGYRVRTGGMDGGLAVKHSSVATAR